MQDQRKPNSGISLALAIAATVVWFACLGPGLIAGVMQAAAPGAGDPRAWPVVAVALSFPVLCAVSIVGVWVCFALDRRSKRSKPSIALIAVAALPIVPIAIGAIAIVVGLGAMAASGKPMGMQETWATTPPSELVWTKPKNGLTLGAPHDTTGYDGGTTAPITVTMRNVGSSAIVCRGIQSRDIVVTGAHRTMHGETSPAPTFPPDSDATTLQPSQSVAQTIDLAGAVFPQGRYRVTITWPCKDDSARDIVPAPQTNVVLTIP